MAALITIEDGICMDARIVLAAVAPIPLRVSKAEKALIGKPVNAAAAEAASKSALAGATPLSMNAYKVKIAKTVIKRAILSEASGYRH